MNTKRTILLAAAGAFALASQSSAAVVIDLYDWGLNIDNTVYAAPGIYSPPGAGQLPSSVDVSGFTFSNGYQSGGGLGTILVNIAGAGAHTVDLFVDHEIDEAVNGFSNETGSSNGVAAAGQSWEVDEPGFVNGDIYVNFANSAFDNGVGVSVFGDTVFPDDVSMGMGWDFSLLADETATITFLLSEIAPTGFYLTHSDPDSAASIYLSSTLDVGSSGPSVVPLPTTLALMGAGLLGLGGFARRRVT